MVNEMDWIGLKGVIVEWKDYDLKLSFWWSIYDLDVWIVYIP
jgi:hypothetical protein